MKNRVIRFGLRARGRLFLEGTSELANRCCQEVGDPGGGNGICTSPEARKRDRKVQELRPCIPSEGLEYPL